MEEKLYFKNEEGLRLCGIWIDAQRKTDRAIILAHGITVEKNEDGIFTDLAGHLAENGFAVFRFDFRGHGESEGESKDMTLSGEIKDLEAAFRHVEVKGFSDIGILGASYGGGISVLFTKKYERDIKALCLWNPVLDYDHCFLNPTLPWIRQRKEHMKEDIARQGWTTLGSNKVKLGKKLFDEMAETFPYKELQKLSLPICIIHGDKDMKVPYEDSVEYSKDLNNVELVTIAGADHGFHDSQKEAQKANEATSSFFKKFLN